MTLTEFLLAHIAEDEAAASRSASVLLIAHIDRCKEVYSEEWYTFKHHERWGPTRVLAECAAKRRIIALAAEAESRTHDDDPMPEGSEWLLGRRQGASAALRALALPYADRADYLPEWNQSVENSRSQVHPATSSAPPE